MKNRYLILGAGMQGTAAAYDMGRFGDAAEIILADSDPERARASAARLNGLLGMNLCKSLALDVKDERALDSALDGMSAAMSCVPYFLNAALTAAAVRKGVSFCDLGGNTGVVLDQLNMHEEALRAGVSVIPDCGLMPGMGNTIAVYGMNRMEECDEVQIRCGGLPVNPRPPLGYKKVFSLEGLTNEYFGKALVLREGKVVEIETFSELEEIEFPPPLGKCEAFSTSGGASTCPYTFQGKVREYNYKTVRYPGHYEKLKTLLELGFLGTEPTDVEGRRVIPRKIVHRLIEPLIDFPQDRDLIVLRVHVKGKREGRPIEITVDLLDFQDEKTGFTAMERTTAFPASIVAIMMARGLTPKGAVPLEKAVDPELFMPELAARGFDLQLTVKGAWNLGFLTPLRSVAPERPCVPAPS
jgi:lysine 6-dehydrogenase